mmetsp:Transcript_41069/g.55978  ORF Transcript_41069/g.55978 Transcript_41069/m.55978 type:complete len:104 (-) Transcript_41069:197-508(-)
MLTTRLAFAVFSFRRLEEMHKALKVNMQVRGIYLQAHGRLDKQSWLSFQKVMATYAFAGLRWNPKESPGLQSSPCESTIADGDWIQDALRKSRIIVESEIDVH